MEASINLKLQKFSSLKFSKSYRNYTKKYKNILEGSDCNRNEKYVLKNKTCKNSKKMYK